MNDQSGSFKRRVAKITGYTNTRDFANLFSIGSCLLAVVVFISLHSRVQLTQLRSEQIISRMEHLQQNLDQLPPSNETKRLEKALEAERIQAEQDQGTEYQQDAKLKIYTLILLVAGLSGIAFQYLEKPAPRQPAVEAAQDRARQQIGEGNGVSASKRDRSSVVVNLESLRSKVNERDVSFLFQESQTRLGNEIYILTRRGNLNLVVGGFTTLGAAAALVYMVTRTHADFSSLASVFSFYIPRLTTVALIETFAYFFLSLYKRSLDEIKFYQNERTTLTALEIAWRVSPWPSRHRSTSLVINRIASFDRNKVAESPVPLNGEEGSDFTAIASTLFKILGDYAKSKGKEG